MRLMPRRTPAPWHPPRPQVRSVPLLPALAAVLVLLAGLELYSWVSTASVSPLQVVGRAFRSVPSWAPEAPRLLRHHQNVFAADDPRTQPPQLIRLTLPPRPQDIQMGNPAGRVRVTLLTDPACAPCRATVQTWLAQLAHPDLHVVIKYWPQNPRNLTGGLVLAMAQKSGVLPRLWPELKAAKGDLTDTQLLGLLDQAGVSFERQRAFLSEEPDLGHGMDMDISQGRKAGLGAPPQVAIDGTVIDPATLAEAVETRLHNRPLPGDAWMMQR